MRQNLLQSCFILVAAAGGACLAKESQEEPVRWTTTEHAAGSDVGELAGTWRLLKGEGDPKVIAALPGEIRFDTDRVRLVPREGNFDGLDFLGPDGAIIRAIYRFDGKKLIVSQTQPGRDRPKGFHPGKVISVWSAERR